MGKLLFIPVSVAGGLLAGFIGTRIFKAIWGLIDDQEPPDSEHRDVNWPKLIMALALEGAIFRLGRGVADRAARLAFYRTTGAWPGEEQPEQA